MLVSFCAYNEFFRAFNFYFFYCLIQSVNVHTHTYICTCVCYSNEFDLRKIRFTQNLQERNDFVTRGTPVIETFVSSTTSVNICWTEREARVLGTRNVGNILVGNRRRKRDL
jgi:hypothetical protein